MFKRVIKGVLASFFVVTLASCAYKGEGVDNVVVRRAVWFSFVAGDDIRHACAAGGGDQYRLVYNGKWQEQVRIYELGLTGPRTLDQRVIGPNQLSVVLLNDPMVVWEGTPGKKVLSQDQYDTLVGAFQKSGLFDDPPSGLRMASDDFYWTAASCRQGHFYFNAWRYPSPRFDALSFVQPLLADDATGIEFNPPREFNSIDLANKPRDDQERWYIEARKGGLVGVYH